MFRALGKVRNFIECIFPNNLGFVRGTEKLTSVVGHDVVQYLNKFPALESPADIDTWKKFCEEHPSKELRSTFYIHMPSTLIP
jgi:hypothetical protein